MLDYHVIAHTDRHILNPLKQSDLLELGQACQLEEGMRVLDLACGKGEALVQWARAYGIVGVGVGRQAAFIEDAKNRAYELDVGDKVNFITEAPADYPQPHHQFDVISWMMTAEDAALRPRLDLMRTALSPHDGRLMVGAWYWHSTPDADVCDALGIDAAALPTLATISDQFDGFELLDMTLPMVRQHDRYQSAQWSAVRRFIDENADHPHRADLQAQVNRQRRRYLQHARECLGWGVFVLAQTEAASGGAKASPDTPVQVEIENAMVWVVLTDGRVIGNPLAWYPALAVKPDATVEIGLSSVRWPELDLTLGVRAMLRGRH